MVSPAWWDDIWLNESFANWMGFRIGNEWRPDLNIGAGALEEGFAAMGTDALLAGRPIHQPIARNSQIDAAFDTITYGKGGHVVSMIAAFMGDTKFRDGVRGYMAKHKYGNASTADFFGAMADAAGDPRILPAMQSFTDQQGVPLVTFAPAGEGKWTVTQSRYVRLGTKARPRPGHSAVPAPGRRAPVPVAGGPERDDRRAGQWRADAQCRRHRLLSLRTACRAVGQPDRARVHSARREALAAIDSLEASFMAGRATPAQMVAAARSFAANPDSYASDGATGQLVSFDDRGLLTPAAHDGLRRLVSEVRGPQLAKLGFDPRAGAHATDDPDQQQRRVALVAEMAGTAEDAALNARLAKAADGLLAGDAGALDPAFYNSAFKAWLKPRGLEGAKVLMEKALSSEDPVLRPALLRRGPQQRSGHGKVADRGLFRQAPAPVGTADGHFAGHRFAQDLGTGLCLGQCPSRQPAQERWRHLPGAQPAAGGQHILLGRQGPGDHRLASALRQQLRRAGTRSRDRARAGLRRAQGPARRGALGRTGCREVTRRGEVFDLPTQPLARHEKGRLPHQEGAPLHAQIRRRTGYSTTAPQLPHT
jgi:hypothetical protein